MVDTTGMTEAEKAHVVDKLHGDLCVCLDQIMSIYEDDKQPRLTLVIRFPDDKEKDGLVGNDTDLDAVIESLERTRENAKSKKGTYWRGADPDEETETEETEEGETK